MSLLAEDRQLLSRLRAGERESMEIVFRHYAPLLSARVARGGPTRPASPFEIGAVVQKTFARAFTEHARGAYDGASDYVEYLAALARNVEPRPASSANAGATAGSAPPSPQQVAEEKELHGLVSAFLAGRDVKERDVYRVRFEQHLAQEDAAAVLGLTRIQVRRLEAKLRRELFAHLRASGYLDRGRPVEVPAGDTVAK